jgi:N-acetylneuraminic acid mutarotase
MPRLHHRAHFGVVLLCVAARALHAQPLSALPIAVSNAAVASARIAGESWVFSALGIDSTKRWSGITTRAMAWRASRGTWQTLPNVPGAVGRLAATAQIVRGRLFVFGGYTVDSAGTEHSLPNVDVYDPATDAWSRGTDAPTSVDDAVSGVYRDSLVYLISGWHETDNVQLVQIYDVVRNTWSAATPIPGPGVFGHSGAIAGNTIVFIDGAVRQHADVKYRLEPQTWIGTIDTQQPTTIAWRVGPSHPGPALYRAAAGACGGRIVFAGGTDNPYNYNGIGYNRRPAQPSSLAFVFDVHRSRWTALPSPAGPSMDHRALAFVNSRAWTIGGMVAAQRVTNATVSVAAGRCKT